MQVVERGDRRFADHGEVAEVDTDPEVPPQHGLPGTVVQAPSSNSQRSRNVAVAAAVSSRQHGSGSIASTQMTPVASAMAAKALAQRARLRAMRRRSGGGAPGAR